MTATVKQALRSVRAWMATPAMAERRDALDWLVDMFDAARSASVDADEQLRLDGNRPPGQVVITVGLSGEQMDHLIADLQAVRLQRQLLRLDLAKEKRIACFSLGLAGGLAFVNIVAWIAKATP